MKVLLALDSDEAGQRATYQHAARIAEFTTSWGTPRGGGPTAQALATAQLARDKAHDHWATLDAICEYDASPTVLQARDDAHLLLETIGLHITDLYTDLFRDREWTRYETADEYVESTIPRVVQQDIRTIDYDAIKARVDIVAFASQFTELVQRGNTFKGKCPLSGHNDDTPSFFVYPENNNWNCFGCNQWGDVFDLARDRNFNIRDL